MFKVPRVPMDVDGVDERESCPIPEEAGSEEDKEGSPHIAVEGNVHGGVCVCAERTHTIVIFGLPCCKSGARAARTP